MRRFITSLIAAVFALASIARADIIDPFILAPSAATVSFVGCTSSGAASATYTFTDHATGTAGNRWTIVGAMGYDNVTDWSFTSMTVGGNAATERLDTANAAYQIQNAFYIISNPTGTTATIVVTPSESLFGMTVCVWAGYDLTATTAVDSASQFQTASAAITLDLDVSATGFGLGISNVIGTQTNTWTGMTERDDATTLTGVDYTAADTSTPGTPVSVSSDWTGTGDALGASISFE